MNDPDRQEFAIVIGGLAVTFRVEATDGLIHGYWLGLRDLSLETVQRAAETAIRTKRFMPVPAELRSIAGQMSPEDRAIKAWDEFIQQLDRHGDFCTLEFDDPLINATARNLGGLSDICERLEREAKTWIRKDFERIYAALMRTGIASVEGGPLIGFCEMNNRAQGYLTGETTDYSGRVQSENELRALVRIRTGLPALPSCESEEPQAVIGVSKEVKGGE